LNVSGTTTPATSYVKPTKPNESSTFDVSGKSASTFYTFLLGLHISRRDISIYHNVSKNLSMKNLGRSLLESSDALKHCMI
jgi:hypothetical protein